MSDLDQSRYLSQKVINVASAYFIDTIKKSQISQEQTNLTRDISVNNNRINKLSVRPEPNIRDNKSINKDYDRLMKEREVKNQSIPNPINFSRNNNSNPTMEDINKRYNEIANERDYSNGNISGVNNIDNNRSNQINNLIRDSNKIGPDSINTFNSFPQSNQIVNNHNAITSYNPNDINSMINTNNNLTNYIILICK